MTNKMKKIIKTSLFSTLALTSVLSLTSCNKKINDYIEIEKVNIINPNTFVADKKLGLEITFLNPTKLKIESLDIIKDSKDDKLDETYNDYSINMDKFSNQTKGILYLPYDNFVENDTFSITQVTATNNTENFNFDYAKDLYSITPKVNISKQETVELTNLEIVKMAPKLFYGDEIEFSLKYNCSDTKLIFKSLKFSLLNSKGEKIAEGCPNLLNNKDDTFKKNVKISLPTLEMLPQAFIPNVEETYTIVFEGLNTLSAESKFILNTSNLTQTIKVNKTDFNFVKGSTDLQVEETLSNYNINGERIVSDKSSIRSLSFRISNPQDKQIKSLKINNNWTSSFKAIANGRGETTVLFDNTYLKQIPIGKGLTVQAVELLNESKPIEIKYFNVLEGLAFKVDLIANSIEDLKISNLEKKGLIKNKKVVGSILLNTDITINRKSNDTILNNGYDLEGVFEGNGKKITYDCGVSASHNETKALFNNLNGSIKNLIILGEHSITNSTDLENEGIIANTTTENSVVKNIALRQNVKINKDSSTIKTNIYSKNDFYSVVNENLGEVSNIEISSKISNNYLPFDKAYTFVTAVNRNKGNVSKVVIKFNYDSDLNTKTNSICFTSVASGTKAIHSKIIISQNFLTHTDLKIDLTKRDILFVVDDGTSFDGLVYDKINKFDNFYDQTSKDFKNCDLIKDVTGKIYKKYVEIINNEPEVAEMLNIQKVDFTLINFEEEKFNATDVKHFIIAKLKLMYQYKETYTTESFAVFGRYNSQAFDEFWNIRSLNGNADASLMFVQKNLQH